MQLILPLPPEMQLTTGWQNIPDPVMQWLTPIWQKISQMTTRDIEIVTIGTHPCALRKTYGRGKQRQHLYGRIRLGPTTILFDMSQRLIRLTS